MNYLKHIFKKHLISVLSLGFLIVFAVTFHSIAYNPGETLNPTCAPGEAGCTVEISTGWGLTGNAGTVDGTNFLGTTDSVPLTFRVNNQQAGRIDHLLFNTFFGYNSGINTTGSYNTANGAGALYSNIGGSFNTANGYQALFSNATGTENTANGAYALYSNTRGMGNTAYGVNTLYSNTRGNYNTANGYNALYSNTTGSNNIGNGMYALYSNTTGNYNTANGMYALYSNTTGNYNFANGYQALYFNTAGTDNFANGYQALYSNTTGNQNTANGSSTLYSNTTGNQNTANGYYSLYSNTTGYGNTGDGMYALLANTIGHNNTANGTQALRNNTTGYYNTANGAYALYSNTTGNQNTAIGYESLWKNSDGNNNVGIGMGAGYSANGTGNVFLGYQAGYNETGSDKLYIANSNTATPLIYGVFDADPANQMLTINGKLKISQGSPGAGKVLTSDADGLATWETPAAGGGEATYQVYTALLTQSGSGDPDATVLNSEDDNYLGEIVWSRIGAGNYLGTLEGAFTDVDKVQIFLGGNTGNFGSFYATGWNDVSSIYIASAIQTDINSFTPTDGLIYKLPIEIRVYNP
jgi:hypothetical protein